MMDPHWPTARDYVDRAEANGCAVEIRPLERQGQSFLAIQITAPSGAIAREIVLDLGDPLMSTTIARLDRRLGIKSHLFT